MALVITLILLAVTLVMAIAFLAISSRERGSITTSTETATARLAADSALANAEAQIAANILSTTNPYNYGLLVSTNFINAVGFDNTIGGYDPTNVNYDYLLGGGALNQNQFEQNLANLYYSPRPPVFVTTNSGTPLDFRFYLDLNRNGSFDPNGFLVEVDNNNNIVGTNFNAVGDPEWIGVLERPDSNYGPNNKFLSRYAFICLPAGNTYDLNYIHNQVFNQSLGVQDGYFRNEGVGSWEINLAALLTDLNTNQWTVYSYQEPFGFNTGNSFDDARALLTYRYANNYNSLATMPTTLGALGYSDYQFGNIDLYTMGNLMTNTQLPFVNVVAPIPPWAGSDNTNHFFDLTADLFDPTKTEINVVAPALGFTDRLIQTGTNTFGGSTVSTYDRSTFYRLLAQLGTDSTPESGKMNLNYDNLTPVNGVASATNFLAWTPLGFFTNAADRMLKLYTANWLAAGTNTVTDFNSFTNTFGASVTNAFGVASIPVLVNGRMVYSSAVQRILQLAANMYDSVYYTNNYFLISGNASTPYLPSVFQPIFTVTNENGNENVYISSFAEVTDTSVLSNKLLNLNSGSSVVATLAVETNDLVFGVPLIIGAKKGFPNFNQFSMQSAFGLGRKLQVTRTSTNANPNTYQINQMFNLSLTNQLGVECWNSYGSDYTRPVIISVNDYLSLALTNDEALFPIFSVNYPPFGSSTNLNVWPHFNAQAPNTSFIIPLAVNLASIPASIYHFSPPGLIPTNANPPYETGIVINGSSYPQPAWGLIITNNLQVAIVDFFAHRIVDYVQLSGPNTNIDLKTGVDSKQIQAQNPNATAYNEQWATNVNNGVPVGITSQISVSRDIPGYTNNTSYWNQQDPTTVENEIDAFLAYYDKTPHYNNPSGATLIAAAKSSLAWQVPYTPSTNFYQYITWQANDPLIHYLASDLNDTALHGTPRNPLITTNVVNERYQPWGATMLSLLDSDTNSYNLQFKDPRVSSSDNWDFPTNKFPTVGWLGRVHRGTPWQTVYLKAHNILTEPDTGPMQYADYGTNTWVNWTGDSDRYDAANSAPLQDRYLFDLFTTSPNDNATRGQLSVNQTNFPAWSALFSGMIVPTNLFGGYTVVNPAGVNGANDQYVFPLVQGNLGINNRRANFKNTDGLIGVFEHIGDILSVTNLTEQSPFLNGLNPVSGVSDELYEWLPQQMMSLLRVSTVPRYVIYSYGQTLAPAGANAVVTGGNFPGMITNYQVVAETVTRTVVHFDGAPTNTHAVIESFNIMPPQ